MSKKSKQKPVQPGVANPQPAVASSMARAEELCSPSTIYKAKVILLIALGAFLLVRLYFLSRTMAPWDDVGPIVGFVNNPGVDENVIVKMRDWSYAPGHFFMTKFCAGFGSDYYSLLFWGRLPSLLVWLGGLFAAFVGFRSLLGREYFALTAALSVWAAVSWRGLLESSQAYNYIWVLPVSVFLTWLFVSPKGVAWLTEPRQLWRPALAGFAAGMTCWMTYQGLFVSMAGFLALSIASLRQRNWRAFRGIIMAGLGFSFVFWFVYATSLRYVTSRGGGFGGIPGETLWEKVTFLPGAWFKVFESLFTFVPPPIGSAVIASMVIGLGVWGAGQFVRARRKDVTEIRLLVFSATIVLIWSAVPYTQAFPLSATRHTYVLQFPLLLTLGLLLKYLHLSRRAYAVAAGVAVVAFLATAPILVRSIRNNFDAAKIQQILTENPNAILLGYPGGSSLDYYLYIKQHPDWRFRLADGTWQWGGYMQFLASSQLQIKAWPQPNWNAPNFNITPYLVPPGSVTVYAVGVQAPMTQRDVDLCKTNGFKVVPVAEIAATGSVEPWRWGLAQGSYIGNSFYLYRLEKAKE